MISNGEVPSSNDVDGVPRVAGDVDVMGSTVDERSLVAAFVNGETPLFDCEARNPLADREEDEINAAKIIVFLLMMRKERSPNPRLDRTLGQRGNVRFREGCRRSRDVGLSSGPSSSLARSSKEAGLASRVSSPKKGLKGVPQ